MNPMRDYLGVWPDVGHPPDIPFPHACPRTGKVLCVSHVRYLEWTGARWQTPEEAPAAETPGGGGGPAYHWARDLPPTAPRSSKVLAARVLNGEYPPEVDALLAAEATGAWLGRPSERRDGRARVVAVTRADDHPQYGPQYRVDLEIDGLACVWWTGESCWCDPGDECDVRYTVTRHGIFTGRRVTTVNRVKRVENAEGRAGPGDAGLAAAPVEPGQAAGVPHDHSP